MKDLGLLIAAVGMGALACLIRCGIALIKSYPQLLPASSRKS
jgi:hypothetical protein